MDSKRLKHFKKRKFAKLKGKCEFCSVDMLFEIPKTGSKKFKPENLCNVVHKYPKGDHRRNIIVDGEKRMFLICQKCTDEKSKKDNMENDKNSYGIKYSFETNTGGKHNGDKKMLVEVLGRQVKLKQRKLKRKSEVFMISMTLYGNNYEVVDVGSPVEVTINHNDYSVVVEFILEKVLSEYDFQTREVTTKSVLSLISLEPIICQNNVGENYLSSDPKLNKEHNAEDEGLELSKKISEDDKDVLKLKLENKENRIDTLEKLITVKIHQIKQNIITPSEGKIGILFKEMIKLDEALHDKLLNDYKYAFQIKENIQ